jgi:hypothetical protein
MSKALPVVIVKFSSVGVWSMLSSPINYKEPSAESSLKTLTVPLGRGSPNLFDFTFETCILLAAESEDSLLPPALITM